MPLFFFLSIVIFQNLCYLPVYIYMRIGISALHPTVCVVRDINNVWMFTKDLDTTSLLNRVSYSVSHYTYKYLHIHKYVLAFYESFEWKEHPNIVMMIEEKKHSIWLTEGESEYFTNFICLFVCLHVEKRQKIRTSCEKAYVKLCKPINIWLLGEPAQRPT